MDLKMLRDYANWVDKSPIYILGRVKSKEINGWKNVFSQDEFPEGLPRWAHRVRNYFNQEPLYVTLRVKANLYSYLVNWNSDRKFSENMALSGEVYYDEYNKNWFQMSPGGTIYHFKHPSNMTREAVTQTLSGQRLTPIFKLVSPDGTGGSCETIIKNQFQMRYIGGIITPPIGTSSIGDGERVNVSNLIIRNYKYQGSYNYAETVVAGFDAHEKFDIAPHKLDEDGYINPNDRHSLLSSRKFPKFSGNELLAEQKNYPKKR